MICPKCKAEYREGWVMCSDCRVELVEDDQILEENTAKEVYIQGNLLECPVCSGIHFIKNAPPESENPASLEPAPQGRSFINYICNHCSYIFWFAGKPNPLNNDFIQRTQSVIPSLESDDEATPAGRDECPVCFHPLQIGDKECSYCGYRVTD